MRELFMSEFTMAEHFLSKDLVYERISPIEKRRIMNFALNLGRKAAGQSDWSFPDTIYGQSIKMSMKRDNPNRPVYSEYDPITKEITLYLREIEAVPIANEKKIPRRLRWEIFAAHEYFHFLEWEDLGLLSKKEKVVVLNLYFFQVKSGIRALSEIGATAFVRELLKDKLTLYL